MQSCLVRAVNRFDSPVTLIFTPEQTCYFMSELFQILSSSPVTFRAYQAYSVVTGAMGCGSY